jgi:uncharacterized damage-inducible protein DinB
MSTPQPAIAFRELLDYTDFLARRWLDYFKQHEAALGVVVGGRTGSLHDLVSHIFQVENFFASLLLESPSAPPPTGPPPKLDPLPLESLEAMHNEAREKLRQYIGRADEEGLQQKRTLGPRSVSNRKILAQALIHSIHHWAQVAMEVRQAGFPALPPQDIILSPALD